MNASSWRKAADLVAQGTTVNPQVQAAATAESKQLESLPLSADDSGPPQVIYNSQQPLASSTPRATLTSTPETHTETYCQIIPGISDHLYPTLVADGLFSTQVADNRGTLQNQITSKEEPFNTAIDDTSEDPTIVMGKLVTTAFVSDDIHIPTEKVGCLQVTSQLQEFLNHFPPESKEKAFEQI